MRFLNVFITQDVFTLVPPNFNRELFVGSRGGCTVPHPGLITRVLSINHSLQVPLTLRHRDKQAEMVATVTRQEVPEAT